MRNAAVRLLDNTARIFPNNIAIDDRDTQISYSGYRRLALAVGTGLLRRLNEARRAPIAVFIPKSWKSLVCFMGIQYSGGIYVPIDGRMPPSRLNKILDNLGPAAVITDDAGASALASIGFDGLKTFPVDELLDETPDENLTEARVSKTIDTDPVYIMYTSGSTGVPKGVAIAHRGVLDYADWVTETFRIGPNSVLGNQSPFYFDNSVFDIYSCLKTGAKLVIIPEELFNFPARLPEFLAEKDADTIFWVPTVLINAANSGALDAGIALPRLKQVLFCGEPMPNKPLNAWRGAFPGVLFANLYGPTEITDVCSYYIVDRSFADHEPLPIGKPCENTSCVILTEDGREAAVGEIGELCVLGSGLALCYWNNPEATAAAFTQNPLTTACAERMYRTGDLAYTAPDGLIMYVGRKDSQIKHKGNRIEPGEIETAAKSVAGIGNACAAYDADKEEIVLFYEAASGTALTLRAINRELLKLVPKYMLPGRVQRLDALPLNANGKIDRTLIKDMIYSLTP